LPRVSSEKQKAQRFSAKPLILAVSCTGFEPVTLINFNELRLLS